MVRKAALVRRNSKMLNEVSSNVQEFAHVNAQLKINPAENGATCGTLPAYRNSGTGKAFPMVTRGTVAPRKPSLGTFRGTNAETGRRTVVDYSSSVSNH